MRRILLVACAAALAAASACQKSSNNPPLAQKSTAAAMVQPVVQVLPAEKPRALEAVTEPKDLAPQDMLALTDDGSGSVNHLARARQLQTDGDWSGALTEARRALGDNAQDDEALTLVGRLGQRTHNVPLSVEAYARLATLAPEDTAPLVTEARLLLRIGKAHEAQVAAEQAIARDEVDPEAHHVKARALFSQGQLEAAITEFERVIALEPDHGYALNNLGLAYLRANENEKALGVLGQAAELLPQVAFVENNYGVALERMGLKDQAREAYSRATDLSPKYVKALLNAQRVQHVASARVPMDAEGPSSENPSLGNVSAQGSDDRASGASSSTKSFDPDAME